MQQIFENIVSSKIGKCNSIIHNFKHLESLMEEQNTKTPTSTPRKITRSSTIKPSQSSQSQPSQNVTINCPKCTKPCKGKKGLGIHSRSCLKKNAE